MLKIGLDAAILLFTMVMGDKTVLIFLETSFIKS